VQSYTKDSMMHGRDVQCMRGLDDIFAGGKIRKKAVLLDQFGVLHDGKDAYPGAIEAVDRLSREYGLRLLIVSNSSRRSEGALDNLKKKGFHIESIEGVITSGEVTFQKLVEREDSFWKDRKDCVHLTWGERGAISLKGMDITVVGRDVDRADCILAHGTEALGMHVDGTEAEMCSVDEMKGILDVCATRADVPMIVANPDLVTVHGDELRVMPGTLAKHYEAQGGSVLRMGKPARVIYEEALRMLQLEPHQVIAIGDSLEHDIKGAQSMGIDSVFIGGGIHKDSAMRDSLIDLEGLENLCDEYGCSPTYAIPYFVT
jgi:HAD superfamily hydrolase (TIGR01459 family)